MPNTLKIGGSPDIGKVGWLEIGVQPRADGPDAIVDVYRRGHGVVPHEVVKLQFSSLDLCLVNLHSRAPEDLVQRRVVCPVAIGRSYRVVGSPDQGGQAYANREIGRASCRERV